jgi:hypothetical protein
MLHEWLRLIRKDNATYSDNSIANQREDETVALNIVAAEDAIYIGKQFPFNNFFFWMGSTVNAEASTMTVEYWSNDEWVEAVDILDATSSGGATLARNGAVQFSPDIDYNWTIVNDTSESGNHVPDDLADFTIYNLYWIKITFSADLTAGTVLKRLSYAFTTDSTIVGIDHEIEDFLSHFSQDDYTKQIIAASEETVDELQVRGLLVDEGQVIRIGEVGRAVAYKALEIIYFNLGDSYADKRRSVASKFDKALKIKRFTFDQDLDAFTDRREIKNKISQLVR